MAYEYPEHPTNRPDPTVQNSHQAPDQRKVDRPYLPITLAVVGIFALAVAATVTINEPKELVERLAAQQN